MVKQERIAVIGLGYVGLPVALAFAATDPDTVGFDIDAERIAELEAGRDGTGELARLGRTHPGCVLTSDPALLKGCTFFIIAVPTPIDAQRRPDLSALVSAAHIVGGALQPGGVGVVESTVFPGATEEIVGPALAAASGLARDQFRLGYSPERINPGDHVHTLERIVKVISGEDAPTLDRVARVYGTIVPAGLHRASSIQVAEAAKVIENTQRDLNIALVNELAMIFQLMGISTPEVLAAAGTKWNFLPFRPGLVGGHCIGVDPYYLTHKAQEVGYHPEVILAGRRINDGMGRYVADQVVKLMLKRNIAVAGCRVLVLGLTFKENCPDMRNSKVPDMVAELQAFGAEVWVHDPLAVPQRVADHYGIKLQPWEALPVADAMVLAVPHAWYLDKGPEALLRHLPEVGVLFDLKAALSPDDLPAGITWLSL